MIRTDRVRAFKYYEEAAQADPNWAHPHWLLAADYELFAEYRLAKPEYADARKIALSKAAREFAKAVEIEKSHPQYPPEEHWRLIDLYGDVLWRNGEYERAITVYRDAIKENPNYPSFHYNLACGLAETGDLNAALDELQKAWELRKHFPSGERFEDPHKDSSFKRYLGDPKFETAVRGMK